MRFIILSLLLALSISCSHQSANKESHPEALQVASDTIEVVSYISRFERLNYPVKAIGKIRSIERSNLILDRSGILQSIHVRNGQEVKKGQVIATLRNSAELLQKENAEITLKNALLTFENEMLALGDSAYYKDGWPKVKENVQLKTGVLSAEINLKQAALAYDQTIIKAPLSGIIEGINMQPGDFATTNLPLGSIYNPSSFEVVCNVLEYDVLKMKKGMQVRVYPLADKEVNLDGIVTEINPAVSNKGLARVIVELQNSASLLPGLSARVEINITDKTSIVIPLEAVIKRSERHVVFNIDAGLAKWNYVTLGKDNGEKVQILEGLSENMEIIISNNLQLAHDSPVRLE